MHLNNLKISVLQRRKMQKSLDNSQKISIFAYRNQSIFYDYGDTIDTRLLLASEEALPA